MRRPLSLAVAAAGVLLAVSMLTFLIQNALPGDAAEIRVGQRNDLSPESRTILVEQVRKNYGLDRPLPVQYVKWLSQALRLNFGKDESGESVRSVVAARSGPSFELALVTLALSIPIAMVLAISSVRRSRRWLGALTSAVATAGFVIPPFWLGLLLILAFSVGLRWAPAGGYVAPLQDPVQHVRFLILPVLTLAVPTIAVYFHYLRQSLKETLGAQYVRTARAKGMSERRILYRHALPNALLPTVTIVGIQFGSLIGGVVVVERVFSWPGIGGLMLYSVERQEYNSLVACVLVIAAAYVLVSTLVEVAYHVIDPRLRRA